MITLYRFDQIESSINEYFSDITKAQTADDRYSKIINYLKHLEDLYAGGSIGYAIFPNRVLSIGGLEDNNKLINDILELAVKLDVPNHHLEPGVERERDTKKLQELIRSL